MKLTLASHKQSGFTAIELFITVLIIGVVSAFAVPSMNNIIKNQTISSTSNEIISTLQVARTEAIKRSTTVRVCFRQTQTGTGCNNVSTSDNARYLYVFMDINNDETFNNTDQELYLSNKISHNIIYKQPAIAKLQITKSIAFNSRGNAIFDNDASQSRGVIGICDDRAQNVNGRMIKINNTGRAQVARIQSGDDITC